MTQAMTQAKKADDPSGFGGMTQVMTQVDFVPKTKKNQAKNGLVISVQCEKAPGWGLRRPASAFRREYLTASGERSAFC